jgi:xylono-1,5-lactonase
MSPLPSTSEGRSGTPEHSVAAPLRDEEGLHSVFAADTALGEGLLWDTASQTLFFVDIRRARLWNWDPVRQQARAWDLPQTAGWILPCADGGWIVGLREGIARLDLERATPRIEWVARLHDAATGLRLNDAKADAFGCVWFGTLHDRLESEPHGRLLRLHPDASIEVVEDGLCVPNGPAVSESGHHILHTDSVRRRTWRYILDAHGAIEERVVWRQIPDDSVDEGHPDGMCFDALGSVWQARWGAGCITRLDPQGRETRRIPTGAPYTTNCCFGGPALSDLYITTANQSLSDAERAIHSRAGHLLMLPDAGHGLPARPWGGRGRF